MYLKSYNCFYFSHVMLFMMSIFMFPFAMYLLSTEKVLMLYWSILQINNSGLELMILLDSFGVMTSMVVIFISANVLRFSMSYMESDMFKLRFNILVLLFVLSMNLLIFIPNMIVLLIGWDGLGFTSFLLVIYYQNSKSLGAGMITALTNRLGDAMLLLAIGWSLSSNNWCITGMWDSWASGLIAMSVLLASMTKSAQLPFSSWLPAAMAAPTPVSALVHSSTLVTAGVFLLIRFFNYVSSIKMFESVLLLSACLTMVMSAFCAIIECDLKKVIALSTLSQLSVMMVSLAIGLPSLALFHLISHALFKALLFVCVGSFIFLHFHNQDLRMVGNLVYQLPLTSVCFVIGSFSLCGLPFLSGFYSKDLILEEMLSGVSSGLMMVFVMMATGGTALYSMRLLVVSISNNSLSSSYHSLSNEDKSICYPILNLTMGAIFGGGMISWLLGPFDIECFLTFSMKLLPLYLTILGGLFSFFIGLTLSKNYSFLFGVPMLHDSFCSMWFFVPLSSQMSLYFFKLAYLYLSVVDHGWVENASAQGVFKNLSVLSMKVQPVQSKMISIMMSLSLMILLLVLAFMG